MQSPRAAFELAENAYGETDSNRIWLQQLLEPAGRLLAFPAVASAVTFRVDVPECFRLVDCAGSPEALQILEKCLDVTTPQGRARAFAAGPFILASDRIPRTEPAWNVLGRNGVKDIVAFVCRDPGPIGCMVSFTVDDKPRLTAVDRRRIARAAAHVATALRLRVRGKGEAAVLAPDGRLLDARGQAERREHREALREAVRALDRAQLLRKSDPDSALDAWRALVEGRWSLVQRFDSDGRRFWVARENEPTARKLQKLTLSERQVIGYLAIGHAQKLIAYELGLSESRISRLASSARNKLGVRTLAELVELYSALHEAGEAQ